MPDASQRDASQPRTAPPRAGQDASRWALALVVAILTVPAVGVADLATAGSAPSAASLALAGTAALLVTAALPLRRLGLFGRLLVGAAAGQVCGHAVLSLVAGGAAHHGCLPVVGRGAELGLRFAILRADGSCPPGSLALTAAAAAAASALAAAAVVVLSHVLVAVAGAAALSAGARSWESARRFMGPVVDVVLALVRPVRPLVTVPLRPVAPPATPDVRRPMGRRVVAVHARRGPPVYA